MVHDYLRAHTQAGALDRSRPALQGAPRGGATLKHFARLLGPYLPPSA
jgi:hypothetical protein